MVADKGWYDHAEFTLNPKSRNDYINLLSKDWTLNIDKEKIARNAKIFVGFIFVVHPAENLIMPADVNQKEVRNLI